MSDPEFDSLKREDLHRRHSAKWRHYPGDVIAAWVAEMDFPVAEPVRRAVVAAAERSDFGYPASIEHTGFGQVVAGWMDRSYGWKVDPEAVLILPDVVRALQVGLLVSTEPGDGVVIQPPVYPPFFSVVRDNGRRLVENPMEFRSGRFEIDLEGLDAAMAEAKVFILCNPQNPTGRSFSREELEAMAELAIRHDVLVIADEVHSPLTLSGSIHTVFAMLGDEVAERTITVTAASKAWNFGGLKCGFAIAGSNAVTAKLKSLGHHATGGASILGIEATEAAFTEGAQWIDRVVRYLDGNRRLLADLLNEHLPEVVYAMPEATYLAWLDCRGLNLEPDPHTFFLEEAGVAFSAGPNFGTQGEGFIRFNFATSRAIVTEMVERMAAAVKRSPEG
ncbi:aminotransferase class I/II-fold pyridoxal phosphate-dependent enzyme [soil metagenome]